MVEAGHLVAGKFVFLLLRRKLPPLGDACHDGDRLSLWINDHKGERATAGRRTEEPCAAFLVGPLDRFQPRALGLLQVFPFFRREPH